MRLKNILIMTSALTILFLSCSKKLELKDPQGLDPATALSNDANVKKVLQGGYDALSSANLYGGSFLVLSDLLAADGEVDWVGTFNNYREIWGKNIITTNSLVSGMWLSGYNVINIANSVLENIDKVNVGDQDQVRGEALFLRAAVHFELVRFFAKDYSDGSPGANDGVPVMTKSTNSVPEVTKPARNKVSEVYAAVIADLIEAESLLPEDNSFFATASAAAAILSRVYLQQGNYAGARDAADRAINAASDKSLLSNFMDNFNQGANTAEDLFSLQVNDQDGANDMQVFYSVDIFGARDGDIEVNAKHINLYEPGDQRVTVTSNPSASSQFQFNTAFYTKYGAYRTTKWRDLYKNVNVIRLAEMYLTRAEANFREGTSVGDTPLNDINLIRDRAGLLPLGAVTLANIYLERRRELAFEGFGIHDARRFQRSIDALPWNDNSLLLPIPFRELNANPSLTQNPGY